MLGGQIWQMYSHISTGWYGKQWAGDHAALEQCLRFYGAMQGDDGFMRWISPSLVAFWPKTTRPIGSTRCGGTTRGPAIGNSSATCGRSCARRWLGAGVNDPDGDGLFRDSYEYWNCDSNGKGPKAAVPSAMGWAMLDRAARMAAVVGDAEAEKIIAPWPSRPRAADLRRAVARDEGRLGSIGQDGIWRGHPQTWEEYLADQRRALEPRAGPPGHALGRRALWFRAAAGRASALLQRLVAHPLERANGCPPAIPAWPRWPE